MSEQELYIELGIVGIKNMGEYSSQTQYEKLNVVTYQGSSYCALKSSIGVLPTDTEYWQLYAEKGEKGDTGEQGPKPVKGEDYYTEEDKNEFSTEISYDVRDEVSNQIGNLVSLTPMAVSSVSAMVNTSRIYVNTTDGNWYYYNGSDWVSGGVYQSSSTTNILEVLNNNNILFNKNAKNNYIIKFPFIKGVVQGNGDMVSSDTRLATQEFYRLNINDVLYCDPDYQFSLALYDEDGNFLHYYNSNTANTTPQYVNILNAKKIYDLYDGVSSVRFMLRNKINNQTISAAEGNKFYIVSDKLQLLTILNKSYTDKYIIMQEFINAVPTASGTFSSNEARLTTPIFIPLEYTTDIEIAESSGMEFGLFKYDNNYKGIGYVKNSVGETQTSPSYFTKFSTKSLDKNYKYRIFARYTNLANIDVSEGENIIFNLKSFSDVLTNIENIDDGIVITNQSNNSNDIWSEYDGRLAFGMDIVNAPVPTVNKQQLINYGTLITMKGGDGTDTKYNRWGLHQIECYDKTNYNRITLLTDKHQEYGRKEADLYYYTGASHKNSAYGFFKLGSDVCNHSFDFSRDEMIADGVINAHSVIQLARINQNTDLIRTYDNYEDADTAYEADQAATTANNAKCCKYIQLLNAENGAMFYDSVRHKVVVKINGEWHDMNTTPVPSGTYDF